MRRSRRVVVASALLWVGGALLLGGCSNYSARNARLRDDVASGRLSAALRDVEKASRGKDRLLNLLERALILHLDGRWRESNAVFEQAERLSADLYTRSVSEAALSLVSNDEQIAYRAAPYELALVPYYRALNYAALGERDEAVVEARKATLLLRDYKDLVRAALAEGDTALSDAPLEDHAFLHYLQGMLFEWGGELDDAFIAYRDAARAYRATAGRLAVVTPPWLGEDLLRVGLAGGFAEELEELRREDPGLLPEHLPRDEPGGRVVLLLESGFVPRKISVPVDVPIFKTDRYDNDLTFAVALRGRYFSGWSSGTKIAYWLRFALPELEETPPPARGARVTAGVVGAHAVAVPVEDVAGRARLFFEQAQGKIVLKTIARALAKYGMKKKADEQGKVAGFLANLLGAATEQADTRSWLTLPHTILMARLTLPPGEYDLRVEWTDARGRTVDSDLLPGVVVREGDWTWVSRRLF